MILQIFNKSTEKIVHGQPDRQSFALRKAPCRSLKRVSWLYLYLKDEITILANNFSICENLHNPHKTQPKGGFDTKMTLHTSHHPPQPHKLNISNILVDFMVQQHQEQQEQQQDKNYNNNKNNNYTSAITGPILTKLQG